MGEHSGPTLTFPEARVTLLRMLQQITVLLGQMAAMDAATLERVRELAELGAEVINATMEDEGDPGKGWHELQEDCMRGVNAPEEDER